MSHAARLTRRDLLTGVSAAVLVEALPAYAAPAFKHGGHPQPSGASPLAVTLTFPDGSTAAFDQSSATDIGDYVSAVGGFTQKCYRQRASGYGDFRDGFTVFFRPDAVGARREIVVEFQTEWNISSSVAPSLPNAGVIRNLFVPPASILNKTTGGTSGQSGTIWACVSYVFSTGECVPSPTVSMVLAVGDRLIVPSPPAMAGATAYRVYSNLGALGYDPIYLQAELPIGTDWTAPTTGIVTAGTREKTVSTATIYTAVISGGGLGSPVTVPVNSHWAKTRWRWMSAPRPVVRTYADLVTEKAILPLNTSYLYGALLPGNVTWSGPMGIGGVSVGWGNTGDRAELGFTNDWMAAWLLTGATSAPLEASWRAAAESTGTCPWWVRDVSTGRLFDTAGAPYLAWSNVSGAKYSLPTLNPKGTCANYPQMDNSHTPDFAFVAWRLTDDPYFLEGAQAVALFGLASTNQPDITQTLPYLISNVQPRAWAWGARDVFRVAGFSPVSVPSWLQDRSYWVGTLTNNLNYYDRWRTSTTPQCAVFHTFPHTNEFEGFMQDYITIVTSWIKYTGLFPTWDALCVYSQLYREVLGDINNTLGWDHRMQTPYYVRIIDGLLGAGAQNQNGTGGNYATAPTADTVTTWEDCYVGFVAKADADNASYPTWTAPGTWADDTLQPFQAAYLPWARAALASVVASGSPTAGPNHTWLAAHMISDFAPGKFVANGAAYKWAIAPA